MGKKINFHMWENSRLYTGGFDALAEEPEYTQLIEWYERFVMIATRDDCSSFTLKMMKRVPPGLKKFKVVAVKIVPDKKSTGYHHHAVGVMFKTWNAPTVIFDPVERTSTGQKNVQALPSTWKRYKACDWKVNCGNHFDNLFGHDPARPFCVYQEPEPYARQGNLKGNDGKPW